MANSSRFMMIVMTLVYIRCIEYALAQPELSTQMASLISVVTGAMTGSFAVFINKESKGGIMLSQILSSVIGLGTAF